MGTNCFQMIYSGIKYSADSFVKLNHDGNNAKYGVISLDQPYQFD